VSPPPSDPRSVYPSDVIVVRSSAKLLRLVQTLKCGGTKSWSQNFALFLSTKIQGPILIEYKYISIPSFVCYMLHLCFPVRGPMFINVALMGYDALCKLIVACDKLNYPRPFIITVTCRSPQALWMNRLCLLLHHNDSENFREFIEYTFQSLFTQTQDALSEQNTVVNHSLCRPGQALRAPGCWGFQNFYLIGTRR